MARQRSRPIFSLYLAPSIASASLTVLDFLEAHSNSGKNWRENARYFRTKKLQALGFVLIPGEHPIIPVMLGDAALAQEFSQNAGARYLCNRLLLSRRATRQSPHPHANLCRAQQGRDLNKARSTPLPAVGKED